MRSRRRLGTLVAAGALVAGCGTGSIAAGNPSTIPPPATVEGVGVLPDSSVSEPLPTTSVASTTTAPSTSTEVIEPAIQRPTTAYVIDLGNGRPIDDSRVLMIGDSVLEATTFGDPDDLDRYVATLGWRIWVDAKRGRHMDQGLATVQDLANDDVPWKSGWALDGVQAPLIPQVVVLMLGNNYEGDRAEFEASLAAMLDELDGTERIVLFTVPLYKPVQADVNEVVRVAAERDDRIVLVDWERLGREWDGALRTDDLHPTEFGSSLLAQQIALAIGPAPDLVIGMDLPVLGVLSSEPLPDWTPPKAMETTFATS